MGLTNAGDRSAAAAPPGRPPAIVERVLRFIAAIALLCGVISFTGSSLFDIRDVEVDGNRVLAAGDVMRRAGVLPGDGIFRVNAAAVRRRLRTDPRVMDASVDVRLPDRVAIHVQERAEVAALSVPDGYVLLGADGVAIVRVWTPGGVPVLYADRLDLPGVQTGTVVPSPDVRLGAVLAGNLPDGLRPDVAGIRIDQVGEIVLYTRDGIAVRIGDPEGAAARISRVPAVLAAVRARRMRVAYVDLRFPDSIIVKPIAAGAPDAVPSPPAPRQEKSPQR